MLYLTVLKLKTQQMFNKLFVSIQRFEADMASFCVRKQTSGNKNTSELRGSHINAETSAFGKRAELHHCAHASLQVRLMSL